MAGMKRRWLAALPVAMLWGAGGSGCQERANRVQTEAALRQTVEKMVPGVERATGLKFRRHPAVLRRNRSQVRDYVARKFDEELPPGELAGAQAAYRLFGLIPDTFDLRRVLVNLLTEQIAGYYDPDSNALFVPSDIDPFQLRIVVSHELVHALQHEYVNLDSLTQQKRQNDRRSAAQAVLEGQATFAQIAVLMPEQRPETLPPGWFWRQREVASQQQAQMPEFAQAPPWLRETLIFPYLGGAEFIRWFEHQYPGKQPYGALIPTSTEQILDPTRYAAGDQPRSLAFQAGGGGATPWSTRTTWASSKSSCCSRSSWAVKSARRPPPPGGRGTAIKCSVAAPTCSYGTLCGMTGPQRVASRKGCGAAGKNGGRVVRRTGDLRSRASPWPAGRR